ERYRAVDDAVAEELQPFVVGGAVAAVGQCAAQKLRLGKVVADGEGERLEVHSIFAAGAPPGYFESGSKSMQALRFPKRCTFLEYSAERSTELPSLVIVTSPAPIAVIFSMVCREVNAASKSPRFVPRETGSAASAFNCFLIMKYSKYAGPILNAKSSAKIKITANTMKPVKVTPRSLR